MTATLTLRCQYGSSPGTQTSAVTGADLISADNGTNSLGNRQANPIVVGTRSYEKYLKLRVDVAPANGVTNFLIWGDGAVAANTTLYWAGAVSSYTTPVSTASSIATTDFTTIISSAKGTWDSASYTAIGNTTKYVVFQLSVGSSATPGNWPTETVSYSYDET